MPDTHDKGLRDQLLKALEGGQAHATFDQAVEKFPVDQRGTRPPGQPHSGWELLEHLRIAQRDILDFCLSADHRKLKWPEEYWPSSPAPASEVEWERSVTAVHEDLEAFCELIRDPARDLHTPFAWGDGQTLLREALLILDHGAYHVGELVLLRRGMGIWPR